MTARPNFILKTQRLIKSRAARPEWVYPLTAAERGSVTRAPFEAGFTLIELMIVVVLIGILSALIVPEMKGTFEDALLRSTSRKLVDAFSLASSQAVALGQVCRFHVDTHTGKFELEKRVRHGGIEGFIPIKDLAGSEGALDPRISIQIRETEQPPAEGDDADSPAQFAPPSADAGEQLDGESILFNADGTADSREILLHDRTGFGVVLRLNPITAGIRVRELPHE